MEERERAGSRAGSASSALGPLRSGKNTPLENIDIRPASRSGKNTPQGSRSASRIADLPEEDTVKEMPQVKPLPPIGKENKDGGELSGRTSPAESVSSQGSAVAKPRIIAFRREMSYESGSDDSDDSTRRKKKMVTPSQRETSTKLGLDGRTHTVISTPCQTEWSWTETMKKAGLLGDSDDNAEGLDTGRLSVHETRAKSRGEKSKSSLSVAKSVEDDALSKVPSIGPTESWPPRDDEYGIPILELDTSDSEEDDDYEDGDTLPSIGPPDILKFKRETERGSESSSLDLEERENEFKDMIGKSVDSKGRPLGIFTGVCEFCEKTIKPFPSMEDQKTKPPDELYCCEEYRQFVHFALFNPMEAEHKVDEKIDIKPHGPFGSKQARRAAKERAVLRMRERELARAQQVAAAQQAAAGGGGGVSNFFTFARAMKTINYQLSSQRCLDEGWTVRPSSPLWEESKDPDVFSIEGVDFTMNAKEGLGWELRKKGITLEKYYDDGSLFLVIFPDGTGHVYYPTGNLAIGISSTTPGKFTYVILEDAQEDAHVLAVFEPNGHAGCYFHNGKLRLCLDQMGGMELDAAGAKKKKWNWKDTTTHVHAPPFQPICFALNRCLSLRFMDQDNISLLFKSNRQSCKFNVGARLKLVNPEYIPVKEIEENEVYLSECKTKVEFLLDKVANLMKFPKSPKLDKLQPPLSVVSQAQRTEKLRRSRAIQEATKQEQNKASVSVN